MRTVAITLLFGVVACESQPAAPAAEVAPEAQSPRPTAAPSPPLSPPPASPYYSAEELRALGATGPAAGARETLVCSAEGNGECVCLAPLDCSQGDCITFEENVAAFRE